MKKILKCQSTVDAMLATIIFALVGAPFFAACCTTEAVNNNGSGQPPIVRVVRRSYPVIGFAHSGWRSLPVALSVENPNPYDVRAYVDCAFTHERKTIGALDAIRVPLVLNDRTCDVEFWLSERP